MQQELRTNIVHGVIQDTAIQGIQVTALADKAYLTQAWTRAHEAKEEVSRTKPNTPKTVKGIKERHNLLLSSSRVFPLPIHHHNVLEALGKLELEVFQLLIERVTMQLIIEAVHPCIIVVILQLT